MLYRHYKGEFYRVVFNGFYEPTGEEVVIYMSVKDGRVWVRPMEVFHGTVELKNGSVISRFREIDENLEGTVFV